MIERAAFTLYTGGYNFNVDYNFLFRWAFAVCQAAQHFPVILCGDEMAKRILIDDLQLPISEFRPIEVPNSMYFMPMIAKVYGYRATLEAPTLHIDGDLFVYRKPSREVLEADCCVQNVGVIKEGLASLLAKLRELRPAMNIPPVSMTCCAGVVGFNDLETEAKMIDMSIKLAEDKELQALYKTIKPGWHVTSSIEESLIAAFFANRMTTFLESISGHINTSDWLRAGITHLNGTTKNDPIKRQDVEMRLAVLHPEIYKIAWNVWWEKYSLLS